MIEQSNVQLDLQEEVVEDSSESGMSPGPGTAKALYGQFKIKALHGYGPLVDKVTGEVDIFHEVSQSLQI